MRIESVKVSSGIAPHLDTTLSYAMTGCHRVAHLISIYRTARESTGKKQGRTWPHLSDILRAAVVLCHAILEQVLRDLLAIEADWPRDFLQRIPLSDSHHLRAEKFSLADLHEFGDMKVSDLVRESVSNHLHKRSFTDVGDIVEVLRMCSFDVELVRHLFGDLQAMMERRHHIAHTGDIDEDGGPGHQITCSISAKQVERWNGAVLELVANLGLRPELRLPKKAAKKNETTPS